MTARQSVPPQGSTPLQPTPAWSLPRLPSIKIDQVKFVGVASPILYGALFLAYRAYYAKLHISPEDIGVNNAFVLPRCIGFIVLAVVVAALFASAVFYFVTSNGSTLSNIGGLALGVAIDWFVHHFFVQINGWGRILTFALLISALVVLRELYSRRGLEKIATNSALAAAVLLCVLVPSTAVIRMADTLASTALNAGVVEPFEVLSIPILDVSTTRAMIEWTGDLAARPTTVFGTDPKVKSVPIILLGSGSGKLFLLVVRDTGNSIDELDASNVSIQYDSP